MRLPIDRIRPAASSSSPSNTPSLLTRIASSPIGLSGFYAVKSILQQQHFLHHQKRGIQVNSRHSEVVDLVLCILSFIGSLTIIVPYCLTKQSRKLRHSLILGLATSDLASSAIIIATTAVLLAGGNLSETGPFCQFSGYTFQVAIWTQNLWNLSIAFITYMILVHPLSAFNAKVERYLLWFWPVFWIISFAVNAVGWPVTNFGNVGGYCSFSPNRGGAYFVAVFQFVPRAFVVIVILILYTHLFFFLRRVNMFNRATSNHVSSAGGLGRSTRDSQRQRATLTQEEVDAASDSGEALVDNRHEQQTSTDRRWSTASAMTVWNKWKKSRSQSTVSPQGSVSPRQGSGSSQGKSSLGAPKEQVPVLEMDNFTTISPKSLANDIPPSPNSIKRTQAVVVPIIKAPPPSKRPDIERNAASDRSIIRPQRRSSTAHFDLPDDDSDEDDERKKKDNLQGLLDVLQPMALRRDVRDFGMTSTPREHLKHYSISPAGLDHMKKAQDDEITAESTYPTLNGQGDYPSTEVPSYESQLGQDWTWGMPVGGTVDKTEKSHPPSPTTSRHHFSLFGKRQLNTDNLGTGTNNSNSTDEHGVDTLGSTLNRQASILLLLYPAAYCILFSISIIRVIVDISNPDGSAASKAQRNENLLHTLSRWTIFAQGAIDALVFQFVERSFRMRMKRKRRIAAGEDIPDFWADEVLKRLKNLRRGKTSEK